MKRIWITWESQRRNVELSNALNAKLYQLDKIDRINNLAKKYLLGLYHTAKILVRERPRITFCQNPSLVLSLFLVIIKLVFRTWVGVDAHNAGIFPAEGKLKVLNWIAVIIQRLADLVIVSNDGLKKIVEKNGGKAFVLPDKIPEIPKVTPKQLKGSHNILFISSFASDEPYKNVIGASIDVLPEIVIYVTGNYEEYIDTRLVAPSNLIFTGFLPESQYIEMLNSVDATIDLTTRENCLVCGAYESIAVEKPMILSDTKALRDYFNMGAIYTDNSKESIAQAIHSLVREKDRLTEQVKKLKRLREKEWKETKPTLECLIQKEVLKRK